VKDGTKESAAQATDGKDAKADSVKGEGAKPDAAAEAKACADPESCKAEKKKEPVNVTASVDTVIESPFTETLNSAGTVTARVGHIALLSAPAPTRVTRVLVAVGDRVKQGAEVVELEQQGFDAAVASAEATLTAAERAAERAQRLVAAGVAPRKDAELSAADLASARLNAVNARRARELSHLRSPINGAVTRVNAVLGASVDAGQPLIEIADPSALDVVLHVAPNAADKVRIGASVTLRDGAGSNAAGVATGKVADVGAVVDSVSRGVVVRVTVASSKRTLRLGESLSGDIALAAHPKAITVPDEALVPSGESFRVFVVDGENVAHAREVKIGGRVAGRVWITEGLKAGDVVVTKGAYGMDEGAHVVRAKP
jgi:multidrug efflux system membrane fusion protein